MSRRQIGARIAEWRAARGLTQEALADRIGVTKATISRFESGHRQPNHAMVERIASALGVSLSYSKPAKKAAG